MWRAINHALIVCAVFIVVACISIVISPRHSFGQSSIVTFYNRVVTIIESPPDEKNLKIVCQKKVEDKYISFIGVERKRPLLAAITPQKLKKPHKTIWLKMRFVGEFPMPAGRPRGGTMDWGYVFDRNEDGKIDYVAYLVGPLPVKGKDFPADYPKGRDVNLKQLELFYKSSQLVFRHRADDNYDGKIDAVVLEDMDKERPWVDRWLVIRSLNGQGVLTEGWYFKEDITSRIAEAERSKNGFKMNGIEGPSVFDPEDLNDLSSILSMLNEAAALCKFTKDSF